MVRTKLRRAASVALVAAALLIGAAGLLSSHSTSVPGATSSSLQKYSPDLEWF